MEDEVSWEKFKDLLFTIADEYIPKMVLSKKRKKTTWLIDATIKMIKKKRWAYNPAERSGCSSHKLRYKSISNKVRAMTREDHRSHIEQVTAELPRNQNHSGVG